MTTLRIVYQTPAFFGGTKQTEDISYYPTKEKVQKCFALLKKEPLETAIWFTTEDQSIGFYFDSLNDSENEIVTVKTTSNKHYSTDYSKASIAKCRKTAYKLLA